MRIIQITDSHISVTSPQRAVDLESCIKAINAVTPQPDLVVHTGDITHDGLADEYRTARALLDNLVTPYVVLPGNRDNRKALVHEFINHIPAGTGSEFVQYSLEDNPVRLIFIDTVSHGSKGALCDRRLQQIDSMLAADTDKPVIIFMHHTPFEVSEIPDPFQFEDWQDVEKLLAIFKNYPQIQAIYCGHVHRNVATKVGDLPVSALSCMACDLRKGKLSVVDAERPMFKVINFPEGKY